MAEWNKNAKWGNPQKSVTDKADSSTAEKIEGKKNVRRQTEVFELSSKYLYRRAFGESQLLEKMGIEPLKKGHSYHCITGGNVDSLSFLKIVLLHQNLDYLLFSTWCMAAEDIFQLEEWLKSGKIKKLDAYVGEIFPSSYVVEWRMLNAMFDKYQCGRIACFKNHSKIYAGWGDKFHFAIESSANINTNPRTEQGTIIIDEGLCMFYKEYFDGINSY